MGSAMFSTAQQFASALGISVFGTLFYMLSASHGWLHAMGWCVLIQVLCMVGIVLLTGRRPSAG